MKMEQIFWICDKHVARTLYDDSLTGSDDHEQGNKEGAVYEIVADQLGAGFAICQIAAIYSPWGGWVTTISQIGNFDIGSHK